MLVLKEPGVGSQDPGGLECKSRRHEMAQQNSPGLSPWTGDQAGSALKGRPNGFTISPNFNDRSDLVILRIRHLGRK